MNKLQIYYALPYPFKVLGVSLYGYSLHRWRYGSDTETLVKETLERDTWSTKRWKTWQEERLAFILHLAATKVPYYHDQWQKRRAVGDKASWEILSNWPILDKNVVRNNPSAFISESSKGKHLFVDHTGGTTGKPTLIFEGRETIKKMYALHEARTRRWFGASFPDRWGMLGGQKIIPLTQNRPPYWIWNQGLNQIYFSVFHINSKSAKYYVDAMWKYRPKHLMVYPSACAVLAKHIIQQGLIPPKIDFIVSNSENLLPKYRELMNTAFNCPVIDTYGMAEMCATASECLEGTQHFWPETGIIEIYDNKQTTFLKSEGSIGHYALTGLLNEDMPLIRYINYDIGSLPDWDTRCNCGRTLPSLGKIIGRSNDLIITKDGRELYILDSFYNGLPIIEGQLIQYDLDSFEVKVVPDINYSHKIVFSEISNRLRNYIGDIAIKLTEVTEIEINQNGKFKPFISVINCRTYR